MRAWHLGTVILFRYEVKLLVLSDLHDDFWSESGRDPFNGAEHQLGELDHLILAGDISNKPKVRWKFAFERLSYLLPLERVSLFPGNHDFYDFRIDGEDRLQEIAASFGIQYAQKKQLSFDGIRILCATLWTDFEIGAGSALNAKHVATQMNDYKKIRVAERGYRKLRPSDVLARHRDHRRWLESALSSTFDGRTFVATHHAPHPDVLGNYADDVSAAYASDLSDLIEQYQPERWFFGHCHGTRGRKVGETQLVNVSLGYPEEVSDPAGRIQDLILDL